MDMEYESVAGLSGDPVFVGGFVVSAGRSCSEYDIQFLSESLGTQAQDHFPHLMPTNRSRQMHDQEPPGQDLSGMIAAHDPEKGHDTDISVANAHHTLKSHTHVQQVVPCVHVHIAGGTDGYG